MLSEIYCNLFEFESKWKMTFKPSIKDHRPQENVDIYPQWVR